MKRINKQYWKRMVVPVMLITLFLSCSGTCFAAPPIKDGALFTGEVTDKKGKKFTSSFQITSVDAATGEFTGEVSWHSLNAVHRIEGSIKGNTVVFKETAYIKRGGAHLNCEYAFVFDGQTLQGRWIEPGVDYGPAQYKLQ